MDYVDLELFLIVGDARGMTLGDARCAGRITALPPPFARRLMVATQVESSMSFTRRLHVPLEVL